MRMFRLALLGLLGMALVCPAWAGPGLVPPASRIGDDAARLQLARIYAWTGRLTLAEGLYRRLIAVDPGNPELHAGLAEVFLARGRAVAARDGFAKAVSLAPADQALQLRAALAMNLWGDFYRARALYRRHLARHPRDLAIGLRLARVLSSAQNFELARGMFLRLLRQGAPKMETLAGLCRNQLEAGDPAGCLQYARQALALSPDQAEVLELSGKASLRLGLPQKARGYFLRLAAQKGSLAAGLVGQGLALAAMGRPREAAGLFQRAHRADPGDARAGFLAAGLAGAASPAFLARLTRRGALTPGSLAAWARVYAEHGLYGQAEACHQAALATDPEYFPSRLELAELLAAAGQYGRADRMLAGLIRQFPGASKLLISRARVLSWARRYAESIALYSRIHALNPADSLPLREAARATAWAKDMGRARRLYAAIWADPVDRALPAGSGAGARPALASPVEAYERLAARNPKGGEAEPLRDLAPRYRVQKAAWLEMSGKQALWDKRYLAARRRYLALTAFQPGNQEAWFDLSQAQCALGLCREQRAAYGRLLAVDPLHALARPALAHLRRQMNWGLEAAYTHWRESGYGERARISRQRAELKMEPPAWSDFRAHLAGLAWWERPERYAGESRARGFRLGGEGPLAPRLFARLAWTHKRYQRESLGSRDTGEASLSFKALDRVSLGLGWHRQELLQNAFALRQGSLVDAWWLGLAWQINRRLSADFKARYLDYSDGNRGDWESLQVAWSLTDHPRELKLVADLERRDHRQETREVYQGATLTDMVHPYWAPLDWLGGGLSLQWRHDLARRQYCGGPAHYYQIALGASGDSEGNPGWRAEASWNRRLAAGWSLALKGALFRSDQWNGEGIWINLGYRF